ncbi:MAG: S8 family serine peptidase [Deltaproteobacteria bacterium]|nr:S8 family serine peptidase [Deltaproteobacteria bacterium]
MRLPPPLQPPPPPDTGGFTPDRELPVGFPATWHGGSGYDRRVASEEAARVSAMHSRGGTGRGQTVGVFDLGANPEHPDLAGRYAARCAMGLCNGAMGSANDGRPGLDRRDYSPLNDIDGHGTAVHGVVAASRNGVGIYGVAYEARIASYGVDAPVPWDDGTCFDCGGLNALQHVWGGIFDRQIARGLDWMRSLGVGATNMSWGRTYPWSLDRNLTGDYVGRIMPRTLPAFRAYVEAGGVVVWAAGNSRSVNPDVEAVLPRHFSELEKGWLAVVALGTDGLISQYSSLCGVAADWCIAAPGELLTTRRNGLWDRVGGTSVAAPYVTAGLAALKSMFPNLSYHDVRERVLATANRSVLTHYGRSEIYGRGRLDLDAASRPIGGTNFAVGAMDEGTVVPTDGAQVVLPREAIERYLGGRSIVVLDSFQRAPFEVGLDVFAEERRPYLSMDTLGLEPQRRRYSERDGLGTVAADGYGSRAGGLVGRRSFVGVGQGRGVVQGLAHLDGNRLPVSGYRMSREATGMALGFSGGLGRWQAVAARGVRERDSGGVGISGWNPQTVLAASFSPDLSEEAAGVDTFGVAFAQELHRPMGWQGSGAFGLRGDSFELAWRRNVMARETVRVDVTNRLAHLAVRGGPLLRFDDAQLASVDLDVSFRLHRFVTVEARLGAERPVSSVGGRIRVAAGVDESGRIAYRDVVLGSRDLLSFDKAGLTVRLADESSASVALGVTAVRDGFGRTETLTGLRMDVGF